MKQIIFILTILLLLSCGQNSNSKTRSESNLTEIEKQNDNIPKEIALKFINSYVENSNKMQKSIGIIEWVNLNNLTTNNFKTELKKIIEEADRIDPEFGLEFDPIFNAQDYPEEGFEFESFDDKTDFLVVKGKEWTDFKLTIKMVHENDNWFVDGCGIVNIPNDKLFER